MELKHIDLAHLSVSPANMRCGRKGSDLSNILPSVRARGVLVPLIVRANGSPDTYEIVAGRRRYEAACIVAGEGDGGIEPLPCAVIETGDDAAALEASLIENIARLDCDEVMRWETFTRLVREGRTPEDIALTFGLTDLQVKRTLALGNLLPRIRSLYRAEQIDPATVRHLTLASKARQREWLALYDDPATYAPRASQLKAWLFGGASIPATAALFELTSYAGEIVADLFGDDSYFDSAEQFWTAQTAAIAERAQAYRDAGWSEVVVLPTGEPFSTWEHDRRTKAKGGRVYVSVGSRGDVAFYEGYVTTKEARRQERGDTPERPARPEVTANLQDYIDLHRHAAVRAKLIDAPGVALRVALAHMIAGSPSWSLRVASQRAATDTITESVEVCASEGAFDDRRRAILSLLRFDPDAPTVTHGNGYDQRLTQLFVQLTALPKDDVLAVLAVVVGETLDPRGDIVDALGISLGIDMASVWQADRAFLDSLRDREVMLAMVGNLTSPAVAEANAKEPVKVLRTILTDCVEGSGGRAKVEGWVPRWLTFPATGYTARGGIGSVQRSARAAAALAPQTEPQGEDEPQPDSEPDFALNPESISAAA